MTTKTLIDNLYATYAANGTNYVQQAADTLLLLQTITEEQAQDEGLWFNAETAAEAYLQQELHRLHAVIERL